MGRTQDSQENRGLGRLTGLLTLAGATLFASQTTGVDAPTEAPRPAATIPKLPFARASEKVSLNTAAFPGVARAAAARFAEVEPLQKVRLLVGGGGKLSDEPYWRLREWAGEEGTVAIITIPTADHREEHDSYVKRLERFGFKEIIEMPPLEELRWRSEEFKEKARRARTLIISGGAQLRGLRFQVEHSDAWNVVIEEILNGKGTFTTSASSALLSRCSFVDSRREGDKLKAVIEERGMGVADPRMAFDTHLNRGREWRALQMLDGHPVDLCVSLDSGTVVELRGGTQVQLVGSGRVLLSIRQPDGSILQKELEGTGFETLDLVPSGERVTIAR